MEPNDTEENPGESLDVDTTQPQVEPGENEPQGKFDLQPGCCDAVIRIIRRVKVGSILRPEDNKSEAGKDYGGDTDVVRVLAVGPGVIPTSGECLPDKAIPKVNAIYVYFAKTMKAAFNWRGERLGVIDMRDLGPRVLDEEAALVDTEEGLSVAESNELAAKKAEADKEQADRMATRAKLMARGKAGKRPKIIH